MGQAVQVDQRPAPGRGNRAGQQGTEWLEIATAADLRARLQQLPQVGEQLRELARTDYAAIEYSGLRIRPIRFR
jgi:phage baseplate assembly protein gpV